MKSINSLFFYVSIFIFLTSCSNIDETLITDTEKEEEEIIMTDAWICEMQSFEEDLWFYQMYLEDNGDYIAISDSRILKVSKDGILNSMILTTYPDDDFQTIRIFNDKIFRFHYDNDFQDYDPLAPIELQIYDFDFNLLANHVLDSYGLLYDVEIESDNLFGMLVYDKDNATMKLKKLHLTSGLVSEITLSTTGTKPTNLHILETGDYLCTASSTQDNIFFLDNDLNLVWQKEINTYLISDAKYIQGKGIYLSGRVPAPDFDFNTFVSLMDLNGNIINEIEYDQGERRYPLMEVNNEKVFIIQFEPESQKNMLLSILDYDLNIESTIEIPGNKVVSDIILNENGSFSFTYGIAIDPLDSTFFPKSNNRIFKFDNSYTLPTNIIVQ